ncbi:uncharacterized protein B0T15DRAFT_484814 [Chaetomium strumarium]|uniref:Uncharacterized protein n=1 Tax=Chaetomium strumarium TaxID=1170767 RepID=A0AAJ0M125_9PEZI|nr:hypothetical protein B0T15DRAFT_484814 [Chaetomium strumarium]
MAKEKKSATGADRFPEEVDMRPESSPYTADIVSLLLKDGTALNIPSPLLRRCPKLPCTSIWSTTPRLEITQEVGHVLAHYLFTDTYQCLKPKGLSPHEEAAAEFTTSIQVYALAREYELSSLEELAKLEIERLGNGLPFSVVLEIVRDAYPEPSADDVWFSGYLKSGLESLLRNRSELSDYGIPNAKRKTISVADLLFKNLVELVRDHKILPRGLNAPPQAEALEESAFVMPVPALGSPGLPETCEQDLPGEKSKGKKAKKKAQTSQLDTEPESKHEPEPVKEPATEPEPEKNEEDDFGGSGVSRKHKKKKKGKMFKPEPEPGKEDGWSLCESDGKEIKAWTVCERRSEHVLGNGWEACCSCQDFIRQLSRQLPSGRARD